jgi:apolipoprotein D and lipocalin family protein
MSEPKTVEHVDLARYMGKWYEIAKFPQRFEKGLVGVTATYTMRPDGRVQVVNGGYAGDFDGRYRSAKGKAWVVDTGSNAKLKVSFFWPFAADYWILELGGEYEYAVVGDGSRRYLWILSRTPHMDDKIYNELLGRIKAKGFDISRLEKNPQR